MTDFATFIVPALIVLAGGVLFVLMLAPLIVHLKWENRRRRRRGQWYP